MHNSKVYDFNFVIMLNVMTGEKHLDAKEASREDITRYVLEHKDELNQKLPNGYNLLMLASFNGYADLVRTFMEQGDDPDTRTEEQDTPLMCAASGGHADVVAILFEYGADSNAENKWGRTPLIAAAKGNASGEKTHDGQQVVAKFLLEHGADRHHRDGEGMTPLDCAREADHLEMVKIIETHKPSAKQENKPSAPSNKRRNGTEPA